MKNKLIIPVINIFIIIVISIFVYYKETSKSLEDSFIDSIKLTMNKEADKTIYNFSVKNTSNSQHEYFINLDSNNILTNEDLEYDVVLDNNIIKSSKLDINNELDSNIIEANSTKNYALIIKSNEDSHFNYKLSITENNK